MCGIYKITNLQNNKIYIGQSLNIEQRWQRHLNSKDESAIHLAIQKYGKENFSFSIIEECQPEELNQKEIYWIKELNSQLPYGYNMSPGGKGGAPRAVQCYNEDGKFIQEFSSITAAAEWANTPLEKIVSCCREPNRYFAGNFQWKYSDDTTAIISSRKKRKSQIIYQFDLQGNLINQYNSITEAAQASHIDKSTICACCNGRQKTGGGYQWSYIDNLPALNLKHQKRVVEQYDLNGNYMATYPTISAAAKAVGATPGGVGAVCTGHSKTCKGYIFKYKNSQP